MNPQILFIIYTVLIIVLISIAVFTDKKLYIPVKMLCSCSFLVIALLLGMTPGYNRFAFTGLALCALGDLFMGQYNRYRKKNYMASGILTFLLAHMAFLTYLYHISPGLHWFAILFPSVCCVLLWFLIQKFHLHLGKLKGFTLVYCFFVSSLMGKALCMMMGMLIGNAIHGAIRIGIAATLFWISDFTLIFLYFYHYRSKKLEKATHALNLATYYAAMILLSIPL